MWDEVGKENAKAGIKSESGAFTGNYAEGEAVKRLDPYLLKLEKSVSGTANVIGVIVAVNGKVESLDVFESTPLFKKLWPKLLKSYALDAANAAAEKTAKRPAKRSDALAFIRETGKASAKQTEKKGNVAVARAENDHVLLFSAHDGDQTDAAAAGMGGFGGGGFGGAVHGSGFSK